MTGCYVVQITGRDLVEDEDVVRRFAKGEGVAFTDGVYAAAGLKSWTSPSPRIDIDKSGQIGSRIDVGKLEIFNAPRRVTAAGPLNDILAYSWHHKPAELYWAPDDDWSNAVLCAYGVLEQPLATIATPTLTFSLLDARAALETPLQALKYGGTNSAGSGVDGEADLKGKSRPILYGVANNFPGVLVNKDKQIWELADKAVTVLCVRDGGLKITPGVSRANVASLESNIPTGGTYDYTSTATGTYVRIATIPGGAVTFDGYEGATDADRTHAQIWKRVRTERCGTDAGDINGASVTAVDGLESHQVGWWWADDGWTQKQALDEVLTSLSGYEFRHPTTAEWHIGQLIAPSGTPAVRAVLLHQNAKLKVNERPIMKIDQVRPNYMPNGAPPFRVTVRWGRNYREMTEADFNGLALTSTAHRRLVDKFAKKFRDEVAEDLTIWDPATKTGDFPDAPEMIIETNHLPGVDFVTAPHVATEAARLLALYSSRKGQFRVDINGAPGDIILPGDVFGITYPGFDLDAGAIFRVLQVGWAVDAKRAFISLVVGLQT